MPADTCPICSKPIGPLDLQFYGGKCFPCWYYKKEKESLKPPDDPNVYLDGGWPRTSDEKET